MDIYSIDLSPGEISLLRQSLDTITISGKDAKFIANLQSRLESELSEIQQSQTNKAKELQQALAADAATKKAK